MLAAGASGLLTLGVAGTPAAAQSPEDAGLSGHAGTGTTSSSQDWAVPLADAGGLPPVPTSGGKPITANPFGVGTLALPDNRMAVPDTTAYPASATVYFTRSTNGGVTHSRACTGWLYGPDIVATAAHCLYKEASFNPPGERPVDQLWAWPGRNGANAPFGSCRAIDQYIAAEWIEGADADNIDWSTDYAAVRLDCNIGDTVGWYGMWAPAAGSDVLGAPTTNRGYPQDKPAGSVNAQQWFSEDEIRAVNADGGRVAYGHYTVGGSSGSPVYTERPAGSPGCAGACVVAVHSLGSGAWSGTDYASGPRITPEAMAELLSWRDGGAPVGQCQVDYTVVNQWSSGFQANVEVVNTSSAPVNPWKLAWSFASGQVIADMWSGTYTQDGPNVTVTDAGWNATIPVGGSVSFGFTASLAGDNVDPTTFTLNGATCGLA